MRRSVRLLGVRVDALEKRELLEEITAGISKGERKYLANVNIHALNIAQHNDEFLEILNHSPLVYCDGEGVRLGASLLGVEFPPRIVLTYWIWELAAFAAERGFSIFLLGGTVGEHTMGISTSGGRKARMSFPKSPPRTRISLSSVLACLCKNTGHIAISAALKPM
jgi:UDP-N-acetyl-D-mannosaminuronic acid transferase (WecB/TagA/CpsF family)